MTQHSLQYKLYLISTAPESKLSKHEREVFDHYISWITTSAEHGGLNLTVFADTPQSVFDALTEERNGFCIIKLNGKESLDWSNPLPNTLAAKFYAVAKNPYSSLTDTEQLQYENVKKYFFDIARTRKFSAPIPDNISPNVLKALGIPKDAKEFSWTEADLAK